MQGTTSAPGAAADAVAPATATGPDTEALSFLSLDGMDERDQGDSGVGIDGANAGSQHQAQTCTDDVCVLTSPTPNTFSTPSTTHQRGDRSGNFPSIEVSPMMREQDADLLESMHYASSQVSQYSPGGTPILRPKDRSLPLDDLPMIPAAAITASPMVARIHPSPSSPPRKPSGSPFINTASLGNASAHSISNMDLDASAGVSDSANETTSRSGIATVFGSLSSFRQTQLPPSQQRQVSPLNQRHILHRKINSTKAVSAMGLDIGAATATAIVTTAPVVVAGSAAAAAARGGGVFGSIGNATNATGSAIGAGMGTGIFGSTGSLRRLAPSQASKGASVDSQGTNSIFGTVSNDDCSPRHQAMPVKREPSTTAESPAADFSIPPLSSSGSSSNDGKNKDSERGFRRCLSGEVRRIPTESSDHISSDNKHNDNNKNTAVTGNNTSNGNSNNDVGGDDQLEEETTASPVSVAQEVESSMREKAKRNKDETAQAERAEQRRVNEAMEFAQAVGERIPMRRGDELCIIEDNDDDPDDDDDDASFEPKEIHLPTRHGESQDVSGFDVADVSFHQRSVGTAPTADEKKSVLGQPEETQHEQEHDRDSKQIRGNGNAATGQSQSASIHDESNVPEHDVVNSKPPLQVSIQSIQVVTRPDTANSQAPAKRKVRPAWPFEGDSATFLDDLNDGVESNEVVYKGICANPPEITKRGIQRGNYAQLHRKAWLEVSDKYHRYGKNLRLYYRYWEKLSFPTNNFFSWLDSKGEAAGQPLPNLDECPRSVLDADTVLYITNSKTTERYALDIKTAENGRGLVVDVDGDPVCTGTDGWIFVLRDGVMYGAEKITSIHGQSKQRFHHSSFFGGKAVASAGIILTDENGCITRLYPHSGHYRPSEAHMQRMLYFLYHKGVDLRSFDMDTQQFRRVARDKEPKNKDGSKDKAKDKAKDKDKMKDGNTNSGGKPKDKVEKKKKIDSLHLEKAVHVACFLAHKAGFIGEGVFDSIHRIRRADVTSVSEALLAVDASGGYWRTSSSHQQ